MSKLYPGISPTAASRMERIAGSYASMSRMEQLSFVKGLRESRKRGASARAVKPSRKVEEDEQNSSA